MRTAVAPGSAKDGFSFSGAACAGCAACRCCSCSRLMGSHNLGVDGGELCQVRTLAHPGHIWTSNEMVGNSPTN